MASNFVPLLTTLHLLVVSPMSRVNHLNSVALLELLSFEIFLVLEKKIKFDFLGLSYCFKSQLNIK